MKTKQYRLKLLVFCTVNFMFEPLYAEVKPPEMGAEVFDVIGLEESYSDIRYLSQQAFVGQLLLDNPQIAYSRLQNSIANGRVAYEEGSYEPEFYLNLRYDEQSVQNTATELYSRGESIYDEKRSSTDIGVKTLLGSGAELKVGYSTVHTQSSTINLRYEDGVYENTGSANIAVTQPLLRGFNSPQIKSKIDQAKVEKKIAKFQVKQQMLKTVSEGLAAYWQLFRAQQILKIRLQAVDNAKNTLEDIKRLFHAGRSSKKDLIEAQSVLIERQADLESVMQGELEAQSRLSTLLNMNNYNQSFGFLLTDKPALQPHSIPDHFNTYLGEVLEKWPSYQIALMRQETENFSVNIAREEKKSKLDLSVGYSTSSLENDGRFFRESFKKDYPTWYVALNFSKPLQGNLKAAAQEGVALDKKLQARIDMEAVKVSFTNDLYSKHNHTIRAYLELVKKFNSMRLLEHLLTLEEKQFTKGLSKLSDLYFRQDKFNQAKQRWIDSVARYELAKVSLKLAEGSLLDDYEFKD